MSPERRRVLRGFTLVELLVVVAIIGLVSAATLPAILPALANRQATDAASILQAALANARDSAARTRAPVGLRFLRDQSLALRDSGAPPVILGFSSFVATRTAPDYSEGLVSVQVLATGQLASTSMATFSSGAVTAVTPLTVYGPPQTASGTVLPPTSWYWNIRRGEKIRFNNSGPFYTIVGPMAAGGIGTTASMVWNSTNNPEGYVNEGLPGVTPTGPSGAEFLYLTDGKDNFVTAGSITVPYAKSGYDGYVDELFDGMDNNGDGTVDDLNEWEPDTLAVSVPNLSTYSISRRPALDSRSRVTALPAEIVIDATTYNSTLERSRLPIDFNNLAYFDILFAPNGQVTTNLPYAGTASLPTSPFFHFWLTDRDGVTEPTGTVYPSLPTPFSGLKGERRLVTIQTKSGLVSVNLLETFDGTDAYAPYRDAQNGVRDKL